MKNVILAGVICLIAASSLVALVIGLNSESTTHENKIAIAYFPNIGHAVPIVGMNDGIFKDIMGNTTKIETRVFDSGPQAIESLFAGSVDMAYVGPGPAINGFLNSKDGNIKILAGAASGGTSFVVHPDSDIVLPSDFAGKKIAAPTIGNTQDVSLRHYLSEHGLKPAERGGSVVIYNIPNPDIYTLFVKGEIDAAWVAEPWATILEFELGGKRLFHEETLWPDGEFASVLLVGNADYMDENPKVVVMLVEAHNATVDWINVNPVQTRVVFNEFLDSYLGEPLPDKVIDTALSNLQITSDPKSDSIVTFAQRADSLGYLGRDGYDLSGIFYDNLNQPGGS